MKKSIAMILSIILIMAIMLPASAISSVPVKGIQLDSNKITLNVGQTYNLKITLTPANTTQILKTFATDNKNVATIDAKGNIKGVGKGTATITVYTSNKAISAKCNVTVSPAPEEKAKTVTVYSSHPAEAMNAGIKEFQEKTGIKVDTVAAGTGELLKRIQSENGNALGDVIWGGGADSLSAYSQYFEKYTTTEIAAVDPKYVDANGYWTGESPLPMIIMYNKNLVAEKDVPTGWADLLDAKWKGKIAYADPAKSGSAYTILCTVLTAFVKEKENGWDFVRKFVANLDGKLIGSSSGVYKGVADGEYSLGLTLEKEAIKYINSGAAVGLVYPKEGTSAVPDGIAIIKGAKNLENAKAFVDFILSKDCQTMMSTKIGRRPSRTDVEPPVGFRPLSELKLVDYNFRKASTQKDAVMSMWKNIIVGK
jgi:iron(III) transport system substrate-binding protein